MHQQLPSHRVGQGLKQLLTEQLVGSLSEYQATYESYFLEDDAPLIIPEKAQQELAQIHEMLCLDLRALAHKYSCSLKEMKATFPLQIRAPKLTLGGSTPLGASPVALFNSTHSCSFSFLSALRKQEIRESFFSYQKGKPLHELSFEDSICSNNGSLMEVLLKRDGGSYPSSTTLVEIPGKATTQQLFSSTKEGCLWEQHYKKGCGYTQGKASIITLLLLRAAEGNALSVAKVLLSAGANPNAQVTPFLPSTSHKNKYAKNALSVAYDLNYCEMLELLIEKGAKSNTLHRFRTHDTRSLLHRAWKTGGRMASRRFRLLMGAIGESGIDVGSSAEIELLEHTLLNRTIETKDIHTASTFISRLSAGHSTLRGLLHTTVKSGQYDLVRAVLNRGATVDYTTVASAATLAVYDEQKRILPLLLATAVERSADWKSLYWPSIEHSQNGVLEALLKGKYFFSRILHEREEREAGTAVSFAGTPLMYAACCGKYEALKNLLGSELYQTKTEVDERAGPISEIAAVGYSFKSGDTALFLAAENGEPKSITALLEAGADPYIKNEQGEMPIHRLISSLKRNLKRPGISPHSGKGNGQVGEYFASSLSAMLDHSPGLVNSRDSKERTPLMLLFVAYDAQSETEDANALRPPAAVLLMGGADVSLVDTHGRTAEELIKSELVKKAFLRTIAEVRRHLKIEKPAKMKKKAVGIVKKKKKKKKNIPLDMPPSSGTSFRVGATGMSRVDGEGSSQDHPSTRGQHEDDFLDRSIKKRQRRIH